MSKFYGEAPALLGKIVVECKEMLFYHDMLIKLSGKRLYYLEPRLYCFEPIVKAAIFDFSKLMGEEEYKNHFCFISAKSLFVGEGRPFNRPGWHTDGFMTNDINYVWCDKFPTEFALGKFNLTQDDSKSMSEMEEQAPLADIITYEDNELIRLDQYNVHRVGPHPYPTIRTFVKVSFSKNKYDLVGNAHNYEIDYNWEMKARSVKRNPPFYDKKQ